MRSYSFAFTFKKKKFQDHSFKLKLLPNTKELMQH